MNTFIQKLVHFNNENQRQIMPEYLRDTDWRYQIMKLSDSDLESELSTWSREKMIEWLDWNDPNGIWTDEDAKNENVPMLTRDKAKDYIVRFILT